MRPLRSYCSARLRATLCPVLGKRYFCANIPRDRNAINVRLFYVPLVEPVGTKAPSILGEKGSLMERRTGTHIVILCQGQAYPVPAFR